MLGRQKTVPEEEKVRVQAEMATAQAAAEEARFDLARTLAAVRVHRQSRQTCADPCVALLEHLSQRVYTSGSRMLSCSKIL